jgi:hypothetical protein
MFGSRCSLLREAPGRWAKPSAKHRAEGEPVRDRPERSEGHAQIIDNQLFKALYRRFWSARIKRMKGYALLNSFFR